MTTAKDISDPGSKVTVTVPTYRRPETLLVTLASVAAQSFTDFRVLVSDNDNDPRIRSLVESLGDERFSYCGHENRRDHFNYLLQSATTEFCTILHDDDWYHPDYLDHMVAAMDAYPRAGWGFCRGTAVHAGAGEEPTTPRVPIGRRQYIAPGPSFVTGILDGTFAIAGPSVMFRRLVYDRERFDKGLSAADLDLWLRLGLDYSAIFLHEPLFFGRQWSMADTGDAIASGRILTDLVTIFDRLSGDARLTTVRPIVLAQRKKWIRRCCKEVLRAESRFGRRVPKTGVLAHQGQERDLTICATRWLVTHRTTRRSLRFARIIVNAAKSSVRATRRGR